MDVAGSNIVVTGGASGIGQGLCRRFAELGAQVVVADLDSGGAEATAADIGDRATAVACDVTDQASVDALVATAIERLGHIDLFCANAGSAVGGGLDTPDDHWDLSWRVNVMGLVNAARAVVPHYEERGGGHLMITASGVGLTTGPVHFNYATTKHAAIGVAEWLVINHGHTVTVTCLCPTIVDTPMMPHFGPALMAPLSVDDVVDSVVQGLADEAFLILPSPMPLEQFRVKAADYDGYLEQVRARVAAARAQAEDRS